MVDGCDERKKQLLSPGVGCGSSNVTVTTSERRVCWFSRRTGPLESDTKSSRLFIATGLHCCGCLFLSPGTNQASSDCWEAPEGPKHCLLLIVVERLKNNVSEKVSLPAACFLPGEIERRNLLRPAGGAREQTPGFSAEPKTNPESVSLSECCGDVQTEVTSGAATCTFRRVHQGGDVHWFHGQQQKARLHEDVDTSSVMDEDGWWTISSALRRPLSHQALRCALLSRSGRYLRSASVPTPSSAAPRLVNAGGSLQTSTLPLLCVSIFTLAILNR